MTPSRRHFALLCQIGFAIVVLLTSSALPMLTRPTYWLGRALWNTGDSPGGEAPEKRLHSRRREKSLVYHSAEGSWSNVNGSWRRRFPLQTLCWLPLARAQFTLFLSAGFQVSSLACFFFFFFFCQKLIFYPVVFAHTDCNAFAGYEMQCKMQMGRRANAHTCTPTCR